jgi:hypothetical protein
MIGFLLLEIRINNSTYLFCADITSGQTHTMCGGPAKRCPSKKTRKVALDAHSSSSISADAHVESTKKSAKFVKTEASEHDSANAANLTL